MYLDHICEKLDEIMSIRRDKTWHDFVARTRFENERSRGPHADILDISPERLIILRSATNRRGMAYNKLVAADISVSVSGCLR